MTINPAAEEKTWMDGTPKKEIVAEYDPKDEPFKPLITIKLDNHICEKGVRYIGRATLFKSGKWRCLADVDGALYLVEISIRRRVVEKPSPSEALL
jgi:hypothetical protein